MYRSGGLQQRTLNESCFHVINIIFFLFSEVAFQTVVLYGLPPDLS